jgi:protein-disulfide isomerase
MLPARGWRAASPAATRCKYFAVIDMMFRLQDELIEKTTDTLKLIGKQAGLSAQAVEDCLKDQALLDRINADRGLAKDVLKDKGTPTFFINGETIVGEAAFEEFDSKIKSLLRS